MMETLVEAGQRVLLVWSGQVDAEEMKQFAEKLRDAVGSPGKVSVENSERLKMGKVSFCRLHPAAFPFEKGCLLQSCEL